jgi:hypothetical protein
VIKKPSLISSVLMSKFTVAAILSFSAALAGALSFAVWFLTFDEGGIRRGDLGYYVFIPPAVRNLPLKELCDEVVFGYRTNDSLEPETITMDCSSRASETEIKAAYEGVLAEWSCSSQSAGQNAGSPSGPITFVCRSPSVRVSIATAGNPTVNGCRPTHLEFLYSAL